MEEKNKALMAAETAALTIANQLVLTVASRFGWSPATLLERIQKSLPSVVEQQIYVHMAPDFGIHPESFSKIMDVILGTRQLQHYDLGEKGIAVEVIDLALHTLRVIREDRDEQDIGISMKSAATLALIFGERAVDVVEDVQKNLSEISEVMGWNKLNDRVATALAVRHILRKHEAGSMDLPDVLEYFTPGEVEEVEIE